MAYYRFYSNSAPLTKAEWEAEVDTFLAMLKVMVDDQDKNYGKYVVRYNGDYGNYRVTSVDLAKKCLFVTYERSVGGGYTETEVTGYDFHYPKDAMTQDRYHLEAEFHCVQVYKLQKQKKLFGADNQRKFKINNLLGE